ncbi:MAG: PadR family transcriptional regulator [Anaerovoracaceae bacterium]|jgi:DNA-binding PadR family transcriptional regulator
MGQENQALTEAVYYILISLIEPLHGYGIMQNVETISKGRVRLSPGTLYGALRTLVERGWIDVHYHDRDSGKKEYIITDRGKDAVSAEIHRLRELLANGETATGGMK